MELRKLFGVLVCILMSLPLFADDDIMITRDGSMTPVKIEKISTSQVSFIDLKHKKRGTLIAPSDYVYMIMKEKGNNIFFDENGNQTTSPAIKFDKDDNVMFLNRGEMFVVYEVSVGKEEVTYKLKDKKKAPVQRIKKSELFMIRNSDGTTSLYNDSYHQKQLELKKQKDAEAKARQEAALEAQKANQNRPVANLATSPVASGTKSLPVKADFVPAPNMNPSDLEAAINAINPYTLFRKGSVAEYCFEYKKERTTLGGGPTYFQQIVSDEKVDNGLLVAYIKQACFNKKHEPSKGIAASFKDIVFPVEIDTSGTYHLTHNLAQDILIPTKRQGYGLLIPSNMYPGMQLKCSTLYEDAKNLFGGIVKVETTYDNWKVEAFESLETPAGTFDCVKLTGHLAQKQGRNSKYFGKKITCWMARGIGIVRYEEISDNDKKQIPYITYLNKLDIK